MAKVTGLGGVFFKAADTEATKRWYEEHLGIGGEYGAIFGFADSPDGYALLSPFKSTSDYFDPSPHAIMINLRVDDLDALQAKLEANGVEILGRQDESYGKFAWVLDPNGIKLELWEQVGPAPTA